MQQKQQVLAGFRQPLVIFTDGCCDPSFSSPSGVKAGYGGIMFDPEDNAYEFFRKDISEDLKWYLSLQGSKKQIVGQAEVLPCLLARLIWKERMKNRAVLYFVDNEAARFGLIRGGAKEPHMAQMFSAFWDEEKDNPSMRSLQLESWKERCCSKDLLHRRFILLGS